MGEEEGVTETQKLRNGRIFLVLFSGFTALMIWRKPVIFYDLGTGDLEGRITAHTIRTQTDLSVEWGGSHASLMLNFVNNLNDPDYRQLDELHWESSLDGSYPVHIDTSVSVTKQWPCYVLVSHGVNGITRARMVIKDAFLWTPRHARRCERRSFLQALGLSADHPGPALPSALDKGYVLATEDISFSPLDIAAMRILYADQNAPLTVGDIVERIAAYPPISPP